MIGCCYVSLISAPVDVVKRAKAFIIHPHILSCLVMLAGDACGGSCAGRRQTLLCVSTTTEGAQDTWLGNWQSTCWLRAERGVLTSGIGNSFLSQTTFRERLHLWIKVYPRCYKNRVCRRKFKNLMNTNLIHRNLKMVGKSRYHKSTLLISFFIASFPTFKWTCRKALVL